MTRKQALLKTIKILDTYKNDKEIIIVQQKLNEILLDLPLANWSKPAIFDAIDQWIYENKKIPTVRDMAYKGLPSESVIRRRFGLTCKEFLDFYYPIKKLKCQSNKYYFKTKEEWKLIFKEEYEKIKPYTAKEFDKKRKEMCIRDRYYLVCMLCRQHVIVHVLLYQMEKILFLEETVIFLPN